MLVPFRHTLIILALLATSPLAVATESDTNACLLADMDGLLQTPELRNGLPQYAVIQYRSQLIRYVNSYYRRLADDILHGAGERLDALHKTMGSQGDDCTRHYRDLLLSSGSSEDFALALWNFRRPNT